jgi:hypothetical protein
LPAATGPLDVGIRLSYQIRRLPWLNAAPGVWGFSTGRGLAAASSVFRPEMDPLGGSRPELGEDAPARPTTNKEPLRTPSKYRMTEHLRRQISGRMNGTSAKMA